MARRHGGYSVTVAISGSAGRFGILEPGSRTHQRIASRSHPDRSAPSALVAVSKRSHRSSSTRTARCGVLPCPRALGAIGDPFLRMYTRTIPILNVYVHDNLSCAYTQAAPAAATNTDQGLNRTPDLTRSRSNADFRTGISTQPSDGNGRAGGAVDLWR